MLDLTLVFLFGLLLIALKERRSQMAKKRRNANGEGTIYQIKKGKYKGRWVAQITIGRTEDGKLKVQIPLWTIRTYNSPKPPAPG